MGTFIKYGYARLSKKHILADAWCWQRHSSFRSEYGVVDFNDRIPRASDDGMGIVTAVGIPRIHYRDGLRGTAGIFRPGAGTTPFVVRLAELHGLLVSADCLTWRRNNDAHASTLSLRLSACQNRVSSTIGYIDGSQPDAGQKCR